MPLIQAIAAHATILVVDDQPANVQTVGTLLAQRGYEVVTAHSGKEALQRCEETPPDLILLDMRMPGMDGFEVCSHLKARVDTATVPIVFLTAASERASVVRGFSAGAVDYVTKPFVEEELLARVKTHVALKRMHDDLTRVARERADLTQIVAHDLKNPLTAILLAAEGVNDLQGPDLEANLQTIRQSANRCIAFIDEYLGRWAMAEKVQMPERCKLKMQPILDAVAKELGPRAEGRGMKIVLNVSNDPEVLGNALVLHQIVDNLVSNAVKYGAAETIVEIGCAIGRSGLLRVTVADRGPGIPAEQTHRLFKRYSRISGGADVAHSSGLGLAMAKEQAERLGAHLWYESRDGGGAVFSLALPLAEAEG